MTNKNIIKRITALILTVALVMVNVPSGYILAENNSDDQYETVVFRVTVNDSQGNEMTSENGVVFKFIEEGIHSDIAYTQLTSAKPQKTYTNTYELTVKKKIDAELVLKVYEAGHPEHIAYITYNDAIKDYNAALTRYASLDYAIYNEKVSNANDISFEKGVYVFETDFDSEASDLIISFEQPVVCEIIAEATKSVNPSVYKVNIGNKENGCTWKVDYETSGDITVRIKPDASNSIQFKETTLVVKVKNKLEFLCANNQNISDVTIEPDESDNRYVGVVNKSISKDGETVQLNLSALDSSDIAYSISNADGSTDKNDTSINNANGTVTIKSGKPVIVKATCSHTGETAQYTLTTVPKTNEIYVNINKTNIISGGSFGIPVIDKYTNYFLDVSIENIKKIEDYYDLEYIFEPDGVFSIDSKNGKLSVLTMSDTPVNMTILATPKSNAYYYGQSEFSFFLNVNQITPSVTFYYDNDLLKKDLAQKHYDMVDYSDVYKDESGNWCLDIPVTAILNYEGEALDDYNISLVSDGLKFDGTTIINADEILRNKEFTIDVIVSDKVSDGQAKRFADITDSFKCILEGNKTYNDEYMFYIVQGTHTGLDGRIWKSLSENIVVNAKESYLVADKNADEAFDLSFTFEGLNTEKPNTDHIIYVSDKNDISNTTHLFFGVDEGLPTIMENEIEYGGENVLSAGNCVYTNEFVTITVNGADNEGNLHCGRLYIGGINEETGNENYIEVPISVSQRNPNEGSAVFTVSKDIYQGLYEGITVAFFDAAGNSSARADIRNILIECNKPNGTISYIEGDDVVIYTDEESGNIYASKDLDLRLLVSDKMFAAEENSISGIKSYNVFINGEFVPELSKDYNIDKGYLPEYEEIVNTALYSENGEVTVTIKDIVDMAGNTYNGADSEDEELSFTIYIDKANPGATFAGVDTIGNANITSFGNFYNSEVEYTFNLIDNMTGVKSAKLIIGNKTIESNITDGMVRYKLPLNTEGEAALTLEDNVGHTTTVKLNEILDSSQNKVFKSDYVIVEKKTEKPVISVLSDESKGNWFNSQVTFNINITDAVNGSLSSGLASYEVYINDTLCGSKVYTGRDKLTDTIPVVINQESVNRLINDNGSYTVKVIVADNAGNIENNIETVYIDSVAPVISDLTGVVNNSINTGTVTVNVEVNEKHYKEDGNNTVVTVTRTLDGQSETYEAAAFSMNSRTTKIPYTFTEDGDYTVTVNSEDAAGNVAAAKTIAFKIDNTAPLADITGVTENAYYLDKADATISIVESNFQDMMVVISITSELNNMVKTIDNVEFDRTQKTSELTQTFTEEGRYTIKVDAVDAAGNVALTRTVMFTVDVSAPVISISGLENGAAYKDEITPVITINDNYYKDYSVSLVKNGIYFNEDMSAVTTNVDVDVSELISDFRDISNGVTGTFDNFEKIQSNDGIYTLIVSATDMAGRISSQTVHFSVNRFGSVYTFDDNLKNIIDTYNASIDTDFCITEYNADNILADSVNIHITRDGSPIDEVIAAKTEIAGSDTGWHQYEYVISKDNFKYDGVYVITVSSTDEAGNNSENITYDELSIRFFVDTTKPEIVKITGLSEASYDADSIDVAYEVFDAVGLKEVKVFLNNNCIQTVTEFADVTSYEGEFTIKEGTGQRVRFTVTDMTGNILDSASAEDIKLGKFPEFNSSVTVTTNVFIRWYTNTPLFYGTVAATGTVIAGGTASAVVIIRKRKLKVR